MLTYFLLGLLGIQYGMGLGRLTSVLGVSALFSAREEVILSTLSAYSRFHLSFISPVCLLKLERMCLSTSSALFSEDIKE